MLGIMGTVAKINDNQHQIIKFAEFATYQLSGIIKNILLCLKFIYRLPMYFYRNVSNGISTSLSYNFGGLNLTIHPSSFAVSILIIL